MLSDSYSIRSAHENHHPFRLRCIDLINFKSISPAQVALAPLSVIVGINSSGKSTLLQPILAICQAIKSREPAQKALLNGDLVQLGTFFDVHSFQIQQRDKMLGGQAMTDWSAIHINLRIMGHEQIPIDWNIKLMPNSTDHLSVHVYQRIMVVAGPDDPYFEGGHYYMACNNENQLTIVFLMDDFSILPGDLLLLDTDDFDRIFDLIIEAPSPGWSEWTLPGSENQTERTPSVVREMEAWRTSFQVDDSLIFDNPEVIEGTPVKYEVKVQEHAEDNRWVRQVIIENVGSTWSTGNNEGEWSIPEILRVNGAIQDLLGSKVAYLGPLRAAPREMAQADLLSGGTNLGKCGEYTAAVLYTKKDDVVRVPLPGGRETKMPLGDATNQWLKWFGLADDATAQSARRTVDLSVRPPGTAMTVDLAAVGVGVSQVLPVILLCLLSEPADVLILEQPELHLHPALQKRMADFLLVFVRAGRQILVETHSDHLVNRLRYQVASDDTDEIRNLVKLIFAEQKDGITTYRESKINEYGGLSEDWPDGFLDISARSAQDLVRQSLRKMKVRRPEPAEAN